MKLTNSMKDSIINAVMGNTPHEYSPDQRDKDALVVCVSKMPEKIRQLWEDKTLRGWVKVEYCSGFNYLPTGGKVHDELKAILLRHKASEESRKKLRAHVKNVVYQFSTDNQMRAAIPELDAYIPKPPEKTKQLPVVNGLMAELCKAGFPSAKRSNA
jgi:hypothetical protein